MRPLIENLGGRRFALTVGAGLVTSALQYLGKLDPAGTTYAAVVIGTVGAYIVGNTTQKWRESGSGKPEGAG